MKLNFESPERVITKQEKEEAINSVEEALKDFDLKVCQDIFFEILAKSNVKNVDQRIDKNGGGRSCIY